MLNVGIIGYGTIGEDVAQALLKGEVGRARLTAVLVRDRTKYDLSGPLGQVVTEQEDEFFGQHLDIIVECAGHHAPTLTRIRSAPCSSDFSP